MDIVMLMLNADLVFLHVWSCSMLKHAHMVVKGALHSPYMTYHSWGCSAWQVHVGRAVNSTQFLAPYN